MDREAAAKTADKMGINTDFVLDVVRNYNEFLKQEAPEKRSPYKWSSFSRKNLSEADERLQRLFNAALADPRCPMDMRVIEGHRGRAEQNAAYNRGVSQLRYPQSRHNSYPSRAVDVVPYPIDWIDIDRFKELGRFIKKKAEEMEIEVQWGGDWRNFKDYPHWQVD